jgi:hypothetical protein
MLVTVFLLRRASGHLISALAIGALAVGILSAGATPASAAKQSILASCLPNNAENAWNASYGTGSAMPQDPITVTPGGIAGGQYTNCQTLTLSPGATTTFTAKAGSGLPVALSASGPCTTSGFSVVTPAESGLCLLHFYTTPNGMQGPGNAYYLLAVGNPALTKQSAKIAAPASGAVKKGKTLELVTSSNRQTNVGQDISWAVTSGGNICKLAAHKGALNLKVKKKGICTVTGSAPGIANVLSDYSLSRTYQAK